MGEAKKRGTYQERKEQGIIKRNASVLAELIHMPEKQLSDLYVHNQVMSAFMAKPETKNSEDNATDHP